MGVKLSMTTDSSSLSRWTHEKAKFSHGGRSSMHDMLLGGERTHYLGIIKYAHVTLVSASTGFPPFEIDTVHYIRRR